MGDKHGLSIDSRVFTIVRGHEVEIREGEICVLDSSSCNSRLSFVDVLV